jgi:hypothetical protein
VRTLNGKGEIHRRNFPPILVAGESVILLQQKEIYGRVSLRTQA